MGGDVGTSEVYDESNNSFVYSTQIKNAIEKFDKIFGITFKNYG